MQRDVLLLFVALDRTGDPRVLGGELLARSQQLEPVVVECRARLGLDHAELLAIAVGGKDGELRLRVAERHLLALERDACGQQLVLELVLALGELVGDQAGLARLAQAVEQLPVVAGRRLLRSLQRLQLLAAEEIGVPADDLRLLGDLLLPHADSAPFLRALEEIALET